MTWHKRVHLLSHGKKKVVWNILSKECLLPLVLPTLQPILHVVPNGRENAPKYVRGGVAIAAPKRISSIHNLREQDGIPPEVFRLVRPLHLYEPVARLLIFLIGVAHGVHGMTKGSLLAGKAVRHFIRVRIAV